MSSKFGYVRAKIHERANIRNIHLADVPATDSYGNKHLIIFYKNSEHKKQVEDMILRTGSVSRYRISILYVWDSREWKNSKNSNA